VAIASAASSARPSVERRVLDVVAALAAELGTAPPRAVTPSDVLDRDLGFGSLERVELVLHGADRRLARLALPRRPRGGRATETVDRMNLFTVESHLN